MIRKVWQSGVSLVKVGLAGALLVGALSAAVEATTSLPAFAGTGALKPVLVHTGIGFTTITKIIPESTTGLVPAPQTYNATNLVTGGKTKADFASLTVLTQPPAGYGTVTLTKTATVAYFKDTPTATTKTTSTYEITYGICAKGIATYSAATLTCTVGILKFGKQTTVFMATRATALGMTVPINLPFNFAATIQKTQGAGTTATPAGVSKGQIFNYQIAVAPKYVPKKITPATIRDFLTLHAILPIPKNFTYVAGSLKAFGGTKETSVTVPAAITYCTAAVATACNATIYTGTGNFKTTYPYIEVDEKKTAKFAGGVTISLPSIFLQLKATGPVNAVGTQVMTQLRALVDITDFLNVTTVVLNMYPGKATTTTTPPAYAAPAPFATIKIDGGTITATTKTSGPATTSTIHVKIEGTHLTTVSKTKVKIGTTTLAATKVLAVAATQVTVIMPKHAPGKVKISMGITTATNCAGTSCIWSKATAFTYYPTVSAVTQNKGPVAGGTFVVLSGLGYSAAATVLFGTTPATTVTYTAAAKTLRAKDPRDPVATGGVVNVRVTVNGVESPITPADDFTYLAAPTFTKIAPATGFTTGLYTATITGHHLAGATVTLGSTVVGIVSDTTTVLKITVPAHTPAGAVNFKITTAGGSVTAPFTYKTPPPTFTSISPTTGLTTGLYTVTISGHHLGGATVTLGATSVGIVSDTTTVLKITVPAHTASGPVDFKITTAGGSVTAPFTYTAPVPTFTSISPPTGLTTGLYTATISGHHLGGATVTLGATSVGIVSDTTTVLKITVPHHTASGPVDFKITTAGGSVTAPFTYLGVPTITSLTPTKGPATGTNTVKITGTNFSGTSTVRFGAVTVVTFTVRSSTQITATAPAGTGTVTVVVKTKAGTSALSAKDHYTYVTAPKITKLTPSKGPLTGRIGAVITGTHLATASVKVNGVTVVPSADTTGSITLNIPSGTGTVTVVVSTAGGTAKTTFTYITAPTITTLTPNKGPLAGYIGAVISGAHLATGTVKVNGVTVVPTSDTTGSITLNIPAGSGTVTVVVSTIGGTAKTTFTYVTAPTITKLTPNKGPLAGHVGAVISGSHLATASVKVNGVTVVPTSDTTGSITLNIPSGAGTVTVVVSTAGGTAKTTFTYITAPKITTVSPLKGSTLGGTLVTLTGTNFATATLVTFGGKSASTVVVSTTGHKITLRTPANPTPITVTITVKTPYGSVTRPNGFKYNQGPSISTIKPAIGSFTGGTPVTLNGSNFIGTITVTFGGSKLTSLTVTTSVIKGVTTPHTPGAVVVVVNTSFGSTTQPGGFTYVGAPSVTSLTPTKGPATGTNNVKITGTNFTPTSTVRFGAATVVTFTVRSSTQITATVPAGTGTVTVVVTAIGGPSAITAADHYTYVTAPSITNLTPAKGPLAGTNNVKITGTNFTATSTVRFGAVSVVTFTVRSTSQITATVPGGTGTVTVVVTAIGGTSAITAADHYTYITAPTITTLTPNKGPLAGYIGAVISGAHLATGTVKVNGVTVVPTSDTTGSITLNIPAGSGTVTVVVSTIGGTAKTTFTYVTAPTITTLAPNKGPLAGHVGAVISGSHLATASVKVNGVTVVPTSDTTGSITLNIPSGAGTVTVVVSTAGGSAKTTFTYIAAPKITTVSPLKGSTLGGTLVTLTGTNFATATLVTFGGKSASTVVVSTTGHKITLRTPANPTPITVTITVKTPYGSVTRPNGFKYNQGPSISTIKPAIGSFTGGTPVTLNGSNFIGTITVTFGGSKLTSLTVTTSVIKGVTTPHTPGAVVVVVNTSFGSTTQPGGFTYVGAPSVTSLTPTKGPATGTNNVKITGTNFTPTSTVRFGAATVVTFTVRSSTQITATVPAGTGTVTVVVTAIGGPSAITAADHYTYVTAPSITNLTPAKGPLAGTNNVKITGTNFTATSTVRFGAVSVVTFTVRSTSQITATVPGGTGTVTVVVTAIGGTSAITAADHYTYITAPTITTLTPNKGPLAGYIGAVISGAHLATGTVKVNGVTVVPTSDTTGSITLNIPSGTGTVTVVVSTIGGTAKTTFTYVTAPTITTLAPNKGPLAGHVGAVISGSHLATASVKVNGVTVVPTSDTTGSITLNIPSGAGTVTVVVSTAGGSAKTTFTYIAAPKITKVIPAAGPVTGNTLVTITGTNFATATSVTFGGKPASTVVVSVTGHQITARTPANPTPIAVTVTIKTPYGTGTKTPAFTYGNHPLITTLSPTYGSFAGGTFVTINGSNLGGATTITFGGLAARTITLSTTSITLRTPAHSAGVEPVSLKTASGTATGTFTYFTVPSVTALAPAKGPIAGTNNVKITGTNFTPTSTVRFGAVGVVTFTVRSTTQITATAPAGSGTVTVVVKAVGGTSAITAADHYTYVTGPTITKLTPNKGPLAGHVGAVITGTHLATATVKVNGVTVVPTSDTTGSITLNIPAGAGTVTVVVSTIGGSATTTFTYVTAPTITTLTPNKGPLAGHVGAVITGTHLATATVKVNGVTVVPTSDTAGSITLNIPSGTGTVTVVVSTTGGSAKTTFTYVTSPTITKLTPAKGPLAGHVGAVITGTHLATATVKINGVTVVPTSDTAGSITLNIPAGAGTVTVVVSTIGGSAKTTFTYVTAPTITKLTPNKGPLAGHIGAVITGTHLATATVKVNGVTVVPTADTAGSITLNIPSGSGTVTVVVSTIGGSAKTTFTYVTAPTITSLAPNKGPLAGHVGAVITGTHLATATVKVNGVTVVPTSDTAGSITLNIPAGAGTVTVVVSTIGGSAKTTFTYVTAPTITKLTPNKGPLAGHVGAVITGTHLATATVKVNGVTVVPTADTAGSITLNIPAGAGTVTVVVSTTGGSATTTFTYVTGPTITSLAPNKGPLAGHVGAVITGTHLATATVKVNGVTVVPTADSTGSITLNIPSGTGTVTVVVSTTAGSAKTTFTYVTAPTITKLTPNKGPLAGHVGAVITGTHLATATVKVNGVTVVPTSDTAGSITLNIPSGTGTVTVVVSTTGGSATTTFTYVTSPTITKLTPNKGPLAGHVGAVIIGTHLATATVKVNGVTVVPTSDTTGSITLNIPAGAGTVTVVVSTIGGSATTTFTYVTAPTITSLAPNKGPLAGHVGAVITGTHLATATVKVNGVTVVPTSDTAGSITLNIPAGSGTVTVVVSTTGGSAKTTFTYVTAPTITKLTPNKGPLAGHVGAVITGTHLATATVKVNGVTVVPTADSTGSITLNIPAGAGTVTVVVSTTGGSAKTTFTYVTAPTITSLAPNKGPLAGHVGAVITGTHLATATVKVNGVTVVPTSDTAGSITLNIPSGTGTVTVVVSTIGGSAKTTFTYVTAPTITKLTPAKGPLAGHIGAVITGTHLATATVKVNGVTVVPTADTAGSITLNIPAGAGTVTVVVSTIGGSAKTTFTYVTSPTITKLTPAKGPLAGHVGAVITGTHLATATVKVNGVTVVPTADTAGSITLNIPAGAGTVTVVVSTIGGSATTAFTYVTAPTITKLTPNKGPLAGHVGAVITGTHLATATVKVNGVTVVPTADSTGSITLNIPAGAGTVTVVVTTTGGSARTTFAYITAPKITKLTPTAGRTIGGGSVTITGTHLATASSVTLNGRGVLVTTDTSSTIVFTLPAGSAGTAPLVVTTIGGTVTANFVYSTKPTVSKVTPDTGPTTGLAGVVITGTLLTDVTSVTVGGRTATVTADSPSSITVDVPAGALGKTTLIVTTSGGVSIAPTGFTYYAVPTVKTITPNFGPVTGENTVTITGTNLTGATVKFATRTATVLIDHSTSLSVLVPQGAAPGRVTVYVSTPGGAAAPKVGAYTYKPVTKPVITSLTPNRGPATGTTTTTIHGHFFTDVSQVLFGAKPATSFTFKSATLIQATVPKGTAGTTVSVSVTTPGGTTSFTGFKYYGKPTVTSVTPSEGPTGGEPGVVIKGTNLTGASISIGSNPAPVKVNGTTSLTITVPAGPVGPANIVITTAWGTITDTGGFTYVAAPVIAKVTPTAGPTAGKSGVVITGTNLLGASVTVGGKKATITSNSSNEITVTVPPGTPGTEPVVVTTEGGPSNVVSFSYRAAPIVVTVTLPTGTSLGGTVVRIYGTFFSTATLVTFGSKPATSLTVSTGLIIATAPAGAPGAVRVTVTTPGGRSTNKHTYTYKVENVPVITSVTPSAGKIKPPIPTIVTIVGSDFVTVPATGAVKFGSVVAPSYTVDGPTLIVAQVPSTQPAGTVAVTVTNRHGTGSKTPGFTYVGLPTITKITRNSGSTNGGNKVTITGTNLTGATVEFASSPATVTANTSTSITVIVPPGLQGKVTVFVTSVGGAVTKPGGYTYVLVALPVVTSVSPRQGPTNGGTTVSIHGSHLTTVTGVEFGTTVAKLTSISATLVVVTTKKATFGGMVGILVESSAGTVTLATEFTFVTAPSVTSVHPSSGPLRGGTAVVIAGTNFSATSSVAFGTKNVVTFSVVNTQTIDATVPGGIATGVVDVTVTTAGGTSALGSTDHYTYDTAPAAPTGATVTPQKPGATVSWTVPSNNSSTITFFQIVLTVNGKVQTPDTVRPGTKSCTVSFSPGATDKCLFTSIPAGSSVSFTVSANNAVGMGPASLPSPTVQLGAVPGPVTNLVALAGDGEATLTWNAPANNGGLTISSFTVTPYANGVAQSTVTFKASGGTSGAPGAADSHVMNGLTNATPYTFSVVATNSIGSGPPVMSNSVTPHSGYWTVASDGGMFAFGNAGYYGSMGGRPLNKPMVGVAPTADNLGYWTVASDGGIFSFGDAVFYGSMGDRPLNKPVVGMAVTPDGKGYWMVASDGGIFSFGDAQFYGSTGDLTLDSPVVGMAVTPDGGGYWMVAADGGIFAFGDAGFYGSLGGVHLNAPVLGMAATRTGGGYWMVAADGGVFSFGNSQSYGSAAGQQLASPVVGIAVSVNGQGYWISEANGVVFNFGDAEPFAAIGKTLNQPIVAMAAMH